MEPVSYILQHGDTLYQLARRYQTTVQCVLARNPGVDPRDLRVAQKIEILPGEKCTGAAQPTLFADMREAWEQHVYWDRMAMLSITERLKDQSDVVARTLKTADGIAKVFEPYYGPAAAESIAKLFTEHIQIAGELITALRDGQADKAKALQAQWYANADKIAETFAGISTNYPVEKTREMLYDHLHLLTQMTALHLAGRYAEDIAAFDKVEQEGLAMADYFSNGIAGTVMG